MNPQPQQTGANSQPKGGLLARFSGAVSGFLGRVVLPQIRNPKSAFRNPTNWYDATRDSRRRKQPTLLLMAEDRILLPFARRRMIGTARDLRRNVSIAAWAIRKHLDFVSTFTFHAKMKDPAKRQRLEDFVAEASKPINFDVAGRHSRSRFARLLEACAVVDGDCGTVPMRDGVHVQAIEGDRIRTPWDNTAVFEGAPNHFVHGVEVDAGGRAIRYAVCKRSILGTSFSLDRYVPARYMWMHGYYDRFDQIRGITPLATSLNEFQDWYEGRVYALAKSKAAQLFGIKFTREGAEALPSRIADMAGDSAANPAGDESGRGEDGEEPDVGQQGCSVDENASRIREAQANSGLPMLDLKKGEDAEFMENKTPSTEFQAFEMAVIQSALKSLDLPMWFFDEARTNFFGSKGALQQYLFSCDIKRENLVAWHDRWTAWRLGGAIARGELDLDYGDIDWEWIPSALPWWQPLEEVKAQAEAVRRGFNNTPRVCRAQGLDAYRLAEEQADYAIYRASLAKKVHDAGGLMPEEEPDLVRVSETDPNQEELDKQKAESGDQTAARNRSESHAQ